MGTLNNIIRITIYPTIKEIDYISGSEEDCLELARQSLGVKNMDDYCIIKRVITPEKSREVTKRRQLTQEEIEVYQNHILEEIYNEIRPATSTSITISEIH